MMIYGCLSSEPGAYDEMDLLSSESAGRLTMWCRMGPMRWSKSWLHLARTSCRFM